MTTQGSLDYWFPVAFSEDVTDRPYGTMLLGERIVVARLDEAPAVLKDLCIHRGSPLSMGRIEGESLRCAYHGWLYDRNGRCISIPQRPPEAPIPPKACVPSYPVIERYGAIWTTLGNPQKDDLPAFPEFEDPGWRVVKLPPMTWESSAGRMMENFLDAGHFAWVHTGLLGDPERPLVHVSELERHDDGFSYTVETEIRVDGGWTSDSILYRYRLPYWFRITEAGYRPTERVVHGLDSDEGGAANGARYRFDIVIQPMTRTRSRRYTWISRDYDTDPTSDDSYRSVQMTVADQDQPIVEAQRPEELPLDITAELHIRGVDAPAIALRRLLKEVGITESVLAP